MTCQRPGCTNEVGPRKNVMGPTPKYCEDKECRRLRNNAASLLHYNRAAGKAPKFKAKGIRKGKRHGGVVGTREATNVMDGQSRDRRPRSTVIKLAKLQYGSNPAHVVIPKEKKVVDGKVSLVDRQAKLAGIDRGTREGFKRYMEERPVYFEWVFPRMTIAQAWAQMAR